MSIRRDDRDKNKDVSTEAVSEGTTPERVQHQPAQEGAESPAPVNEERLQDGYRVNEGSDYQQGEPEQQENYDPAHSGVRHSQRKPGTQANTPGREGQTGWSEQMQMGHTTDTAEESKNPSN